MARSCFYCGAPAVADDSGIPAWAVERLGLGGTPVEHLVATAAAPAPRRPDSPAAQLPYSLPSHAALGDEQPGQRLHEAIEDSISERTELVLSQYSVRSLCAGCATLVREIDRRARPLLLPLIDGEAATLDPREQRLVAAWGARAAYAALAVEKKAQGVPRSHRCALREQGEPHANVFVGLGRYRPNHVGVIAARLLTPLEETGGTVEAYTVLAVLGHLILKVFGIHRLPAGVRVKPPVGEMVRVWPAHPEPVPWPPIWGLTELTLEHAFLSEPFCRPFRYSEVRYLGPGKKYRVKRKRTEGLRGRW